MCPITWAKGLVETQGIAEAVNIMRTYSKTHFGKDRDIKNPYRMFYKNAFAWVRNRHKEVVEKV